MGRSPDIETKFLEKAWSSSKNLKMGRSPDIETIFLEKAWSFSKNHKMDRSPDIETKIIRWAGHPILRLFF